MSLLREGSSGPDVRWVQEKLKNLGYNPGPIDGIFGSKTKAAVIAFQKHRMLAADGIVGLKTQEHLELQDGCSG